MRAKVFVFTLFLLLIIGGIGISIKVPTWKTATQNLLQQAKNAGMDQKAWAEVVQTSQDLPQVYPFTNIQSITSHAKESVDILHSLQKDIPPFEPEVPLETASIDQIFVKLETLEDHFKKIKQNVQRLPSIGLSTSEKEQLRTLKQKLAQGQLAFNQMSIVRKVFEDFKKDNKRILILLQNQNEPRSTGGFVGSVLLVDFTETNITWKFSDIYALDRQIPQDTLDPSPEFFQELSPTLSLRDANLFPDFPTSAQIYQRFFDDIPEKTPDTIIAINLNILREILRITGPIQLDKWNITANEQNFDMVLSFLVEAKVSGRFNVKDPVILFAQKLFDPTLWKDTDLSTLEILDPEAFLTQKNILAYSKTKKLQKLFERWDIAGRVQPHPEADNFLQFDFISVGANKSEKFMWTKLWHDSKVLQSGKVLNTLEIQRRHNIQNGELDTLLGANTWFENIRDLLTDDIRWKLGEGQNRTVLRVSVPTNARLITQFNPSGAITESFSKDGKRKYFEVPLYISRGEKNTVTLTYETTLRRGSHNWRPYVLQLIGTPGRAQTTFLQTISSHGQFTAETLNIGRPVDLVDQDFRAVIDFRE